MKWMILTVIGTALMVNGQEARPPMTAARVIIAVLIFAQQPSKTPEGKGAAEGKGAQVSGGQDQQSQSQQTPSSPANNQHPSAKTQVPASKAGDDAEIQGKIETFTGLLVIVGFLQFLALIGQVVIYCRQARIMERQAHEMKRQRGYMRLQWKAMGVQATHMEGQLAEMSTQSGILQRSVGIAGKSADAASLSAQALINSERPWLFITATSTDNQNTAYEFRAANYGRTPLEIIYEKAETRIVTSEDEVPILFPKAEWKLLNVQPLLPVKDIADMQQARQMPGWTTVSRNIKGFFPMTILSGCGQGDKLDVTNSVSLVVSQTGSHKKLKHQASAYPVYVWSYGDGDELGSKSLSRIAKHTGLRPEDL